PYGECLCERSEAIHCLLAPGTVQNQAAEFDAGSFRRLTAPRDDLLMGNVFASEAKQSIACLPQARGRTKRASSTLDRSIASAFLR
ncbi:MAG: hypothetical protein WD382_02675, partial [Halofilum sp. (in: g-proteobacteria)]